MSIPLSFARCSLAAGLVFAIALVGCGEKSSPSSSTNTTDAYGNLNTDLIKFKNDVQSNAEPASEDLELTFVDLQGNPVELASYRGQKNVVLVFTRGFNSTGQLCPYCVTQTSRLVTNYSDFQARDAEIVVVFPGEKTHVGEFVQQSGAGSIAFPIVLDEDLKNVEKLGIRADLSKPSTYILDKQGNVRFAYIGQYTGDRPSVTALLTQLDAIAADPANK